MSVAERCAHSRLRFGSGGYYIFCVEPACSRRWVAARSATDDSPGESDGTSGELVRVSDAQQAFATAKLIASGASPRRSPSGMVPVVKFPMASEEPEKKP